MQGRISETFKRLKKEGKKALITFITAGDPDIRTTKKMILQLERNGSDIIELGVPFSDPMADGPTIQASSERALKRRVTLAECLSVVKEVRKRSEVPIVLFGYYNTFLQYGLRRVARDAKDSGVDAFLAVDLPPEEAAGFRKGLRKNNIDLIFLLTPTSDDERMRKVARAASGFIYFVSVTGVTGARGALSRDVHGYVKRIREFSGLPVGVGFGISTPAQAREAVRFSDAAIVGSALINEISKAGSEGEALRNAGRFVKGLRQGIDRI
jgi:tryptophan synthase alpha chain